jgi:two-component system cell cycle sensor histidine kinase/response regulator CckA
MRREDFVMTREPTYEEFEKRVEQRTSELAEANEKLRQEIQKHKETEQALREKEALYHTLIEVSPDGIMMTDLQGNIMFINSQAVANHGYKSQDEMLSVVKNALDLCAPHERERFIQGLNNLLGTGIIRGVEYDLLSLRKDGTLFPGDLNLSLVRDTAGNPYAIIGTIRDVTERKRAEQELREHRDRLEQAAEERTAELTQAVRRLQQEIEERKRLAEALKETGAKFKELYSESKRAKEVYDSLLDTSADAIIIYDMEGKIKYVNRAFEQIFGWTLDEAKGKPIEFVPESEEEVAKAHMKDIVEHGKACSDFETKRFTKDGSVLDMSVSGSRYNDHEGKPAGTLVIFRDISEKKKIQAQLMQAKKMEAIATLAGGIAHQFNNALTTITGYVGLLEMDHRQDEKIAEYTTAMKQSAHRMALLTRQLLAYARGGRYNPQILSLGDFIRETLPLIQSAINPMIRVETDLPLDTMNVEIDRTQMQMVVSAIVANSNEAIEGPGRIRISTRNMDLDMEFIKDHPGLKPGPYVCLSIEDDGKGMDEETKSRIFEPFFTTHFIGRGLGMASVYGIIKGHDGWISVDSELGKGTVVRIYLPAIEAKALVEKKEDVKAKIEPAKTGPTILVIEDEEDVMIITRQALERLGYRVIEARTGQEAVEIARSFEGDIDLALLDIKLPDMRGDKVYPLVMEARPDLKVIVCTGYSIEGPAQEILDAGAEGFIQKPFLVSALDDKLKEVLGKNRVTDYGRGNRTTD